MTQTPHPVYDLRSALALLRKLPGQLLTTWTSKSIQWPNSPAYTVTSARAVPSNAPTKEGPAMLFKISKTTRMRRSFIGLLASRTRVGHLLGCDPKRLGFLLKDSVTHPIPPVVIPNADAKCQEVVHLASDPDLTSAPFSRHLRTRRRMPDLTSHSACAMPAIRIPESRT